MLTHATKVSPDSEIPEDHPSQDGEQHSPEVAGIILLLEV